MHTSCTRDGRPAHPTPQISRSADPNAQEHAEAQHAQYLAALQAAQEESDALRHQLEAARGGKAGDTHIHHHNEKKSSFCSVM